MQWIVIIHSVLAAVAGRGIWLVDLGLMLGHRGIRLWGMLCRAAMKGAAQNWPEGAWMLHSLCIA